MIGFLVRKIFGSKNDRFLKKLRPLVAKINALEPEMQALADEELPQRLAVYREQVQNGEKDLDAVLPEVFALVREASTRVLGMRHYDVQLLGAMALHNGKIAEMKTGEGKTRSLKDYITDIRDIACPSAKCNFGAVDYFPNQVMYLCADIDDLKRDTGFEPTVDFKTGIKNTVEWYKEQNNG